MDNIYTVAETALLAFTAGGFLLGGLLAYRGLVRLAAQVQDLAAALRAADRPAPGRRSRAEQLTEVLPRPLAPPWPPRADSPTTVLPTYKPERPR